MLIADAQFLAAVVLLGVAWAFVHADPDTATSRALAAGLALAGVSIVANRVLVTLLAAGPLPAWARALVVPEMLAFCAAFEWIHRVRRTIPAGQLRTRFGDAALRVAQGLAVLYGVNGMRYAEMRIRDFYGGLDGPAIWSSEVVRLFLAPLEVAMLLATLSIVLCLNRDPEPAERVRLVAFLFAAPIMAAGLVLPPVMAPTTTVLGLAVLLGGQLRYAQLRGRQGQFMSRFLSPQVATLVNRDGLRAAMREERRELSIVAVDLRGFTAFAGARDSRAVIALLRDYYDAIGTAVLAFEGTVKDYAGDGVLILLGAPVAAADHARRALALAERIRATVTPIVTRAGGEDRPLGVGIAVASGPVTVGIIGGEGRLEYAAVGQAVNLAARLCEQAAAGEILVAGECVRLLADDALAVRCATRAPLSLKGFEAPVEFCALLPTG